MFRLEPKDHENEMREMIRFFVRVQRLKLTGQYNMPKTVDVRTDMPDGNNQSKKPEEKK